MTTVPMLRILDVVFTNTSPTCLGFANNPIANNAIKAVIIALLIILLLPTLPFVKLFTALMTIKNIAAISVAKSKNSPMLPSQN